MNTTNLAFANVEYKNDYELPEWEYFVCQITEVFHLSHNEEQQLKNSNTARIIAAIPFVAGCIEPERTAIAHLCIYMAELRGFQKYYAHLPSDDTNLYNRLKAISNFNEGNKHIIQHGMDMLAYIMVKGYNDSKEQDAVKGIYNPINTGAWNAATLTKELLEKINAFTCPALDKYFEPVRAGWHH